MKNIDKLVKKRKVIYALTALAVGVLCAVAIFFIVFANVDSIFGFFDGLTRVLAPIIIGLVLAYIIDPVSKFFETRVFVKMKNENVRRTVSLVIALVLVIALLIVFIGTLIPNLISSVSMLISNADSYYANIEKAVDHINSLGFGLHIDLSTIEASVKGWFGDFVNNISENLTSILNTTKNIGAVILNILIGVILAIYILFSKKYLLSGLQRLRKALFTPKQYESNTRFWKRCHDIFTQYISCNIIDALIIGVSNAIYMLILGMPYVPLVSFVVGVANLIPTFGPIIGGGIGALVLVLVKPSYALWFLIFTVGIQILDAYVVKPRLFSSSIGLAPVWTLIAITVGGNLFGIIGILLAIPVAAILTIIYDEWFIPWLQNKSKERAAKADDNAEEEDAVPQEADESEIERE